MGKHACQFDFLIESLLVRSNVILHLLVLLEQEPEHPVKLLVRLDLHFRVRADRAQLLL